MKKLLALVLALVMTLGLATVGANAATKYADADSINYDEAVDVMTAIGVLGGDETGFRPADTLKRSEGAKIVAYLMLGNKAAEAIQASGNKFTDVPANHWAAGYIEYLSSVGVLGGVGEGKFDPDGQLTATQFGKMLLVALGYDANIEGFGGSDWSINVQKVANQVGIYSGNSSVVGSNAVTREEAALYAFNTVKAPLVKYDNKGSTVSVNGATIDFGASNWSYMTTAAVGERYSNIANKRENEGGTYAQIIEFGEQYYEGLKLRADADDFGRPANKWTYNNTKIGTYVDKADLVASYTVAVKGSDLYNLLGKEQIQAGKLTYYVNGEENETIAQSNMIKTNTASYGTTGKGVLTEVYKLDDDIRIVSINTYMGKVLSDYNKTKETVNVQIYLNPNGKDDATHGAITEVLKLEDFPQIENYKEDMPVIVTGTWNNVNRTANEFDPVTVKVPNFVQDVTVTKFKTGEYIVVGGEQKDYAKNVFLAPDDNGVDNPLLGYNQSALSNYTYDVSYDDYGYVKGIQVHTGDARYVFLASYDFSGSNLGAGQATGYLIFADGSTATARINADDTNDNITATTGTGTGDGGSNEEFATDYPEITPSNRTEAKAAQYNMWFTYAEKDGVYTLSPVKNWLVRENSEEVTKALHVNPSTARIAGGEITGSMKAMYGNDASTYITVESGAVANETIQVGIKKVTGVYTGVQNVDIEPFARKNTTEVTKDPATGDNYLDLGTDAGDVFAVANNSGYIVAAVIVGENAGGNSSKAYVVKTEQNESYSGGYYYWDVQVIYDGELVTKTVKENYTRAVKNAITKIGTYAGDDTDAYEQAAIYTLTFDNDGYIVDAKQSFGDKAYKLDNITTEIDPDKYTTYEVIKTDENTKLTAVKNTLYTGIENDVGLTKLASGKVWTIQQVLKGSNDASVTNPKVTEFESLTEAVDSLAPGNGAFKGVISAVLDSSGRAQWIVLKSTLKDTITDDNGFNAASGLSKITVTATTGEKLGIALLDENDETLAASKSVSLSVYRSLGNGTMLIGTYTVDGDATELPITVQKDVEYVVIETASAISGSATGADE